MAGVAVGEASDVVAAARLNGPDEFDMVVVAQLCKGVSIRINRLSAEVLIDASWKWDTRVGTMISRLLANYESPLGLKHRRGDTYSQWLRTD